MLIRMLNQSTKYREAETTRLHRVSVYSHSAGSERHLFIRFDFNGCANFDLVSVDLQALVLRLMCLLGPWLYRLPHFIDLGSYDQM